MKGIIYKVFQKIEEEGMFLNLIYEVSVILRVKLDEDMVNKL